MPGRAVSGEADAPEIGDWLQIEADGRVIVFTGKVEVGQKIRTSLAQAVAEELRVAIDSISLVMADTGRTPFDAGTVGSRTTPFMAAHLRKVAASARELLLDLAAERLGAARAELEASGGMIRHAQTGQTIGFGDLTGGRRLTERYGDDAPLTPPERWSAAGRAAGAVEGRAIVTGERRYTPDLAPAGMLIGRMLRAPSFGARLQSLDVGRAAALQGVTVVHENDFVGVVAASRRRADEALDALQAEWTVPPQISAAELFEYLRSNPLPPDPNPGWGGFQSYEQGSMEEGSVVAARTVRQRYTVAYIAHAPLEPRAALAAWEHERLTVWTGTQRPFGVRDELASAFDIPVEHVRVIVPDTGGAYGGKHTGDAALEAARLARAAGRPVKLVWTREEEFTWAYFRPAGVIEIAAAVDEDARLVAWDYHNYNSGAAGMRTPYEAPNQRIVFQPTLAPLRQGSYRALAATANHFAREAHMDELAQAVEMDPLEFRLHNLRDERLQGVLEAAAERFGWWSREHAPGRGCGIAGGTEKGSYVATCVEVAVDPDSGELRILRIVQAVECGKVVNPDGLRSQVKGAIIQGLGGALFEAVDFADGRILTNRFSSYRVPRFSDAPPIEVVLVDRPDLPSAGAGETPIVGIAPALANAMCDATGVRVRSLPLAPEGRLPRADRLGA